MSRKLTTRDISVDTLRGIACILLVAFHVVGHNTNAGIHVDPDSPYRYFVQSAVYLRMPLFAFLSGVVYAWRPLNTSSGYATFIGKKAKRLLIPFVFFVPAIGVAQLVVPASNSETTIPPYLWYVYPLSPYWFLISTFWIFVVVAWADSKSLLNKPKVIVAVIVSIFIIDIAVPSPDLTYDTFGSRSALFLLPFFLVGVAATRLGWRNAPARWIALTSVVAAVSFIITQFGINGAIDSIPGRHNPVGIILGVSLCLLLLSARMRIRGLAWIGAYSSGIFLFHPFTVAGTRAVLQHLGVHNTHLLFIGGLVCGIAFAIAAVWCFRLTPLSRFLIGEKWHSASPHRRSP